MGEVLDGFADLIFLGDLAAVGAAGDVVEALAGIGKAPRTSSIAAKSSPKSKGKTTPKIGAEMPDGTVYVGVSPETRKPMYATPADASLTYTAKEARKYAAKLDANGHQYWRVPTKGELSVLFRNRAAIGGFNETGSGPAGWYWSSFKVNYGGARIQNFRNGKSLVNDKTTISTLRCVR